MKITIPYHSIVDVITNSSTVIYTWASATAEDMVKDLINEVLNKAGSSKNFDDLYSVKVVLADSVLEQIVDGITDGYGDLEDYRITKIREIGEEEIDWPTKWAQQREYLAQNFSKDELIVLHNDHYDYYWLETELVVESLDGSNSKIDKILSNLFEHEAMMDG